QQGEILGTIDMSNVGAVKVCVTDDRSIWTISSAFAEPRRAGDAVLRNYKFGSGLVQTVVPKVSDGVVPYSGRKANMVLRSAIACNDKEVYALLPEDEGPGAVWMQVEGEEQLPPVKVRDADIHANANNFFAKSRDVIDGEGVFLIFQADPESNRYIP